MARGKKEGTVLGVKDLDVYQQYSEMADRMYQERDEKDGFRVAGRVPFKTTAEGAVISVHGERICRAFDEETQAMCNAVMKNGGAPMNKHLTNHHNPPVLFQGDGATTTKFVKQELEPFYRQYVKCHETAGTANPVPFPATVEKPESASNLLPWFDEDEKAFTKQMQFGKDGKMLTPLKGEYFDLTNDEGVIDAYKVRKFYYQRNTGIKANCRVCKGIGRMCPDFHQYSDCLMTCSFEYDEEQYDMALEQADLEKDKKFKGTVDSRWLKPRPPNGHFGSIMPAEKRSVRKALIIANKIEKIMEAEKAQQVALKKAATELAKANKKKSEIARKSREEAKTEQ